MLYESGIGFLFRAVTFGLHVNICVGAIYAQKFRFDSVQLQ